MPGGKGERAMTRGVRLLAGLGLLMAVSACGGGQDSAGDPPPTSASHRQTVGAAVVSYPAGWTIMPAARRPQGWDWAVEDGVGDAATVQVAVDGNYSYQPSAELSTAELLAAAQVGAYPGFAVQAKHGAKVPGAVDAVRTSFTYNVFGTKYEGVWLVARASDSRTAVVQISGKAPLDDDLVEDLVHGVHVIPGGSGA
jgi:hypothetical protein